MWTQLKLVIDAIIIKQLYRPMFEIKSQHEHADLDCHPRKQADNEFQQVDLVPLEPIIPKPKIRKIRIKSLPGDDPQQYFVADSLIPSLEESIALLPAVDFQVISARRKDLELFVYTSLVEDGKDYLMRLFKTDNKNQYYVHELVSETVYNINDSIINEILEGQHDVHRIARPTKQDIFNNGRTTEAAIRIRESMLKAKLSDLKSDINTSGLNPSSNPSSILNLNSADLYSDTSFKTQRAKQFVKRMQELQEEKRREREQKEEYKRQKKLEEESQRKEIQERVKREKHQFLVKEFQRKRDEKERERKEQEAKNAEFKAFLEEFKGKTPLFKQKQKEFFQKFVIPQNNKKLQILKQIRQDRKPLSHEQLLQHEKQYLEIREDHVYEKNAARAVQEKTRKPEKPYYKSKFHSLIEKEEKQREEVVDQSQIRAKMYTKRLDYSNEIKTKFVPKVDLKKKEEMAKKIEELSWLEKVRINQSTNIDAYKKDGKDNLEKLHKYIGQLKAKGKIRTDSFRTVQTSPQPNKARYKNYLHELRDSATASQVKPSRSQSIDYSTLLTSSEDAQRFKLELKKKQEVASRREQYIANLGSRNLEKYMEEKRKLDDDYLESAKAKMAILNKFQ